MSEPERLFDLPIEELAERVTAAYLIVQLIPTQGETPWMAAERIFAEELAIPVLQQYTPTLDPDGKDAATAFLRNTPPFARYASYLRSAVMTTYDPEPPDVDVPRTAWMYARRVLFCGLAIALRSLTVAVICCWIETALYMRARDDTPRPYQMVRNWEQALGRAFSRVQEYGIHLKKVDDEFDWVGMSSTPMEMNQRARRIVSHVALGILVALALVIDVIIRGVLWLLRP
jgi:hypothetical protein